MITHIHPEWGSLLQVQGATYEQPVEDFETVKRRTTRQVTFFPVLKAVNAGLMKRVANVEVPDVYQEFPTFRSNIRDKDGNYSAPWTLWDGETSWTHDNIEAVRYFPIKETISFPGLKERVETKYRIFFDV